MKKQIALLLTLVLMVGLLAACGGSDKEKNNNGNDKGADGGSDKKQRIALVLPEKIGVNPFFELMDQGLKKAGEEFGVEVKTTEASDPAAFEQNLRSAVADNYDLIITATFQAEDALNKVAAENPNRPFAIVDTKVDLPNVRSVAFREHEAAFLLGAVAGLVTKTNKVGAVVAMDVPIMTRYTKGFEQGLKQTNPNAEFIINYVNSFNDAAKGKELALDQHAKGADFIAGIAAIGDFGVWEAAKEQGFYSSGQDVDRTVEDPEHVIVSQLKGADTVTYETVKSFVNNTFEFGEVDYGLKEDGVGLTYVTRDSVTPLSPAIGQENIDKVKALAQDVISGKIEVMSK
ncbi:BMP family lipoprotein [Paenibacillus sp. IITD108]|uniref:BMP family lipoprotein n=1 Tax=Paenibacillus sp. IITD108 TaxID=3116649 RepID=UPI002F41045C